MKPPMTPPIILKTSEFSQIWSSFTVPSPKKRKNAITSDMWSVVVNRETPVSPPNNR